MLLHIITHSIILLHPPLLRIITLSIFTRFLRHYYIHEYYIIIILLLRIITFSIITYYYKIIVTYYYIIIAVFLHGYYTIYYFIVIKGKSCNNDYIITCNAKSKPLLLHYFFTLYYVIITPCSIITLITYFSLPNLQVNIVGCLVLR